MRVDLGLAGTIGTGSGEIAFAPTLALLDAVLVEGSLRGAAGRLRLSYRSAWGRFSALEATLGHAVILKTKGHGSILTPYGIALHSALDQASRQSEDSLLRAGRALAAALAALPGTEPALLRLAISHDSVLLDALAEIGGIAVTIAGSMDALHRLASDHVDGAGFHFGGAVPAPGTAFAAVLADRALTTRPVFRREQGLMLANGNPLAIAGIRDLARDGVRFVNRQRGAGTRIWFDRLCGEAGLTGRDISGYETEEFTHQAVAALIATGAADVGMGTRAIAERFGLGFLSLGEETYFLAVRSGVEAERIDTIATAIRRRVEVTPGYTAC